MTEVRVTASERFAAWLKIKGWSVRRGARETGFHGQKLHRIIHGQDPKSEDIDQFCTALGITVPEFYGDIGDDRADSGGSADIDDTREAAAR